MKKEKKKQTLYSLHTTQLMIVPDGKQIFEEGVTEIGVTDEAAGPFVYIKQRDDLNEQVVRFDEAELDLLVEAIEVVRETICNMEQEK